MGLHLCYELALPRETTATAVAERVRLLHEAATRLPVAKVSSLVRVADTEALGDVNLFDCSLEDFFRLGALGRLDPVDEHTGKRADRLPDGVAELASHFSSRHTLCGVIGSEPWRRNG